MQKMKIVKDLPILEVHSSNCLAYQYGKQNRLPFSKTTWRASNKLQLIHTDIAGPQRTPSLKGSLYYIIFVDELTRMCWIYFLKHKSEASNVFQKFKAKVENEANCKIQSVRTDNGKEYTSYQFDMLCEEAGIHH